MSALQFLHGVEVIDVTTGSRPISTVASSVIGIVGTAPDADPTLFPYDTPVLIAGSLTAAAGLDTTGNGLGTLPAALKGIMAQAGAVVVVVRVAKGTTDAETLASVLGGINSSTGAYTGSYAFLAAESLIGFAPRLLIAPGFTQTRVTGGITSLTLGAGGTGYTSAPTVAFAGGGGGTGAAATAVVTAGVVTGLTITNPGSGYTAAPTVSFTGGAGTGATATATFGTTGNPVVANFIGIATSLRAHIIADGPNTNQAAAIGYAGDFGSRRVYVVDPQVIDPTSETQWASSYVAGLIAQIDNTKGFWWSPSNNALNGVIGTARAIDFQLGNASSAANLMNAANVATIVRSGGYVLWGNRTLSSDPKWAFLCVSRTADIINDSVLRSMQWAVDQGITKGYVKAVVESVNAYLRTLTNLGAILGGTCWVDPALNGADQLALGHITFDFDFTPAYPSEHVTFQSHLVNDYLTTIF